LDYGAGALLIPKIGDFLEAGEPIGEIHANNPAQAELVARLVRVAYTLSPEPVPREDLILDSI
ncbi:MAG: thymidine phosphorylase, partial [Candidatus Cloacimonetes bacterium]|nr:thymidine phosphorylase [Candidatus Cloacimonadota bacterium]